MIIDAHTHIFPPAVRQRREDYFPGEPDFKFIYGTPKSVMVGAEDLIRAMDENQVEVSVVFGFSWRDGDTARMANDYVLEAVQRYPDRLWGLACVHPRARGAAEELSRCLEAGLEGAGELALYVEGEEDLAEVMRPLVEVIRQYRRPLLLHANEPVGHLYPGKARMALASLYKFLKSVADIPVILAHWGGGLFFYELMKKEVPEVLRNVYYDTAASPFLYRRDIYPLALRILGEHKVVFGSDYPLIKPRRYFREMEESGLDRAQMSKICGENIMKLFRP